MTTPFEKHAYKVFTTLLKPDEADYIITNQERCPSCGHLEIFHDHTDDGEHCEICDCIRQWSLK